MMDTYAETHNISVCPLFACEECHELRWDGLFVFPKRCLCKDCIAGYKYESTATPVVCSICGKDCEEQADTAYDVDGVTYCAECADAYWEEAWI